MTKVYWKPEEIIAALNGWDISARIEQLVQPSSEFVLRVYTACLEQVTSLTQSEMNEPVQAALASLQDANPDLYSASIAQNILLYHLTRFAAAASIPNFSSKDLFMPEPKRTKDILSGFVNFIKFAEQCAPFVYGLQEQVTATIEEREKVTRELAEVQRKLSDLKAQRAEDAPRCKELSKENETITGELLANKEVQVALLEDIEKLRVEKKSVLQSKQNLNQDAALTQDNIFRTQLRIVQSPERIRRAITTMSSTATEDKRILMMNETKVRDLQAKIGALSIIEKDLRNCVEQLQTIEKEVQSLEASHKKLSDTRDHLDEKLIERSELHMKRERVMKQLSNAQEKLERAQRHAEEKKVAGDLTIIRLQKEYEEMSLERRENDKQLEELKAEANDVATKTSEHLKKSEVELNELLAEYWELRHQTEIYMETLANKLGMQVSTD